MSLSVAFWPLCLLETGTNITSTGMALMMLAISGYDGYT